MECEINITIKGIMKINFALRPQHILPKIKRLWDLSGAKISLIERSNDLENRR